MSKSFIKTACGLILALGGLAWSAVEIVGNIEAGRDIMTASPDTIQGIKSLSPCVMLLILVIFLFENQIKEFFSPLKVRLIGTGD